MLSLLFKQIKSIRYKIRGYKAIYTHYKNNREYGLINTFVYKTPTNDKTFVIYEDVLTREMYIRELEYFSISFKVRKDL